MRFPASGRCRSSRGTSRPRRSGGASSASTRAAATWSSRGPTGAASCSASTPAAGDATAAGDAMSYETLIVDQAGAIATITLNRPDARNALDFTMRRELLSALDEIEGDPAARVVILTGAGGHFCAGGDVKSMQSSQGSQTAADGRARVVALNHLVMRLVDFPRPVVAMVDGFAVGAGCNLALCCDL